MACDVAAFSTMDWVAGGHPLEQKKTLPARSLTLLRFDVGFEDPAWCVHGHHIFVLEGRFELLLEDGRCELTKGDACVLDPGTRHKARNPGDEPCELFVISRAPGG